MFENVSAVEARGLMPRMLFSSFYDPVLARLRARSASARIALLISPRAPVAIFERARNISAEAINPDVRLVTRDLVDQAHAEGLCVYPYTANDSEEMTRLLDHEGAVHEEESLGGNGGQFAGSHHQVWIGGIENRQGVG